jgi:hypothetical protein
MSVDAKRVRRRSRSKPLVEPDTWFVSYETIMPNGTRHYARATRRFKSEADAKQFAHEVVIKNGWINPYKPKRCSRRIVYWIAEVES